jgi:hypothetical protein
MALVGQMANQLITLHSFTYATLVITDGDNFHNLYLLEEESVVVGPINGPINKSLGNESHLVKGVSE